MRSGYSLNMKINKTPLKKKQTFIHFKQNANEHNKWYPHLYLQTSSSSSSSPSQTSRSPGLTDPKCLIYLSSWREGELPAVSKLFLCVSHQQVDQVTFFTVSLNQILIFAEFVKGILQINTFWSTTISGLVQCKRVTYHSVPASVSAAPYMNVPWQL